MGSLGALLTDDGAWGSGLKIGLFSIGIAIYASTVVRRQRPGISRVLYSLPAILFFLTCPLKISNLPTRGGLGFVIAWLSSFKVSVQRSSTCQIACMH